MRHVIVSRRGIPTGRITSGSWAKFLLTEIPDLSGRIAEFQGQRAIDGGIMNIVIVGGGKASLTLMDYFLSSGEMNVTGIADIKEDAPGIQRAKELKIKTTTRMEELIKRQDTQVVIEITGNDKVRKAIVDMIRPDQEMIPARVAKLMFDMIEAQKKKNVESSEKLSLEFRDLNQRLGSASESIESLLRKVKDVFLSMKILTMNAMIEASRAGEAGQSFGVVAEEMKKMVVAAETAFEDIAMASEETRGMLEHLAQAENKMRTIFSDSV